MTLRSITGGFIGIAALFGATANATAQSTVNMPKFDPGAFRGGPVDNPLFPLTPGSVHVFQVLDDDGDVVGVDSIIVSAVGRPIAGVRAVTVLDRERRRGKIIEETHDWYAQDTAGNVWYLGEDTRTYKFGRLYKVRTGWVAGVKGAQAGIIMLGRPLVGATYRQEDSKGVAEDMGRVLSVDDAVRVPAGSFTHCLTTEDWSPLERGVKERKTYCPGVGLVRERTIEGGSGGSRLISPRVR
jgi:hypothetical protein